jgi:two-component system sensor histidine kinase CpxA
MRDAQIEAQAKSLRLLCPDANPIPVTANADLLYRAIDNVLRNAIRHSPMEGTIAIGFRVDQDHVRLDISDEGPGVPQQDLERIFEAFYRVSPARERSTGGAGLGLALASRILAVHGVEYVPATARTMV